MLTTDEALALATRNLDDSYEALLTDFCSVCVVEFERRLPGEAPTPGVSVEPTPAGHPDSNKAVDAPDQPVDPDPLLVDKRSGEIFQAGNNPDYTAADYAACYLATGSLRGRPEAGVVIAGLPDAGDLNAIIDCIVAATELGQASTRMRLKQIGVDGKVEIEASTKDTAAKLASDLRKLGADAHQLWKNDSQVSTIDGKLFEVDDTDITVDFDEYTQEKK